MNPLTDLSIRPVIAHRGASGYAPENTLPAFELAIAQGADAFELDVRLTADGVPVVIHDPTLERTVGRPTKVGDLTVDQLLEADAGARFSPDRGRSFPFRASGVVIPTLRDVLRSFPTTPLLIDLKESRAQEPVRRVLVEEQAISRCALASDDAAALIGFAEQPFVRAASPQEISRLYWGTILRKMTAAAGYRLLSVPARYRGLRVPTRGFVAAARTMGCPVHVWTVNRATLARSLWDCGVAGIVTDFPDHIVAVR
jgi:glycerophosphoryl diester phosphodiesterase